CLSMPFLPSVFLSIIVLYNCPPSNGPIGKALKIATLKLMNHIQNKKFSTTGKYDPSIGEEYLSCIILENGTLPCAIVGGASRARGFVVNNESYVFKTFFGSEISIIVTPKIPLPGVRSFGNVVCFVIFSPLSFNHEIDIMFPRLALKFPFNSFVVFIFLFCICWMIEPFTSPKDSARVFDPTLVIDTPKTFGLDG